MFHKSSTLLISILSFLCTLPPLLPTSTRCFPVLPRPLSLIPHLQYIYEKNGTLTIFFFAWVRRITSTFMICLLGLRVLRKYQLSSYTLNFNLCFCLRSKKSKIKKLGHNVLGPNAFHAFESWGPQFQKTWGAYLPTRAELATHRGQELSVVFLHFFYPFWLFLFFKKILFR